jgi:molybdate transport system substrate-binding protein
MRRLTASVLTAVAVSASSCASSGGLGGGDGDAGGTLTVFAASSLTDAFTDAGQGFRDQQGTKVRFSFAGSQDLAAQIGQGAPADVLATADTTTMAQVRDELVAAPRTVAHNRLVIVTAKDNPRHVTTLSDLEDPKLAVVLADPSVPAGSYAEQALADAHVDVHPRSLELDVRSVLTKVEVGEADAGIVYATDARSAGDTVTAVPIEGAPTATYQIAAVTDRGEAFVDYMLSADGQAVLRAAGFLPP